MYIIQCPHCLTHTSLKSSLLDPLKYSPLTLMNFSILFDHALKHCEKSSSCDGFEVSRHAGLDILDSLEACPLENPFQLWKKKEIASG